MNIYCGTLNDEDTKVREGIFANLNGNLKNEQEFPGLYPELHIEPDIEFAGLTANENAGPFV